LGRCYVFSHIISSIIHHPSYKEKSAVFICSYIYTFSFLFFSMPLLLGGKKKANPPLLALPVMQRASDAALTSAHKPLALIYLT